MEKNEVEVYGAEWCLKTSNHKNFLQAEWVDFDYFDVERDKDAEERVRGMNDGKLKFPMVVVKGQPMKNPSIKELKEALKENKLLD